MSIYICVNCDNYKDADLEGCNEHPNDECGCVCDDCLGDMEDDKESYCISECYQDYQAMGYETQYNPHMGMG